MKKYRIAVTGCGGGVGQSILKALQDSDYDVVALDGEVLGTGLYSTFKSYIIPYYNHPDFLTRLLEICKLENISLLFPGLDAELMPLSLNRQAFENIGTTVVVSMPEIITISDNKLELYKQLTHLGINIPYTISAEEFNSDKSLFPLILKPKIGGARSKNVYRIRNKSEWDFTVNFIGKNNLSEYVVMEYIEGDEYTCGSVNLNNECKGVIVMRRSLRDGDTYKAFTEKNETIENHVRLLMKHLQPFGAINVQLRLKDGIPHIFEINARCSGTTAARALSGFNEPRMIADYLLKGIEPSYEIKYQTILRYWKEMVVDNSLIEEMKTNRFLDNRNPKKL